MCVFFRKSRILIKSSGLMQSFLFWDLARCPPITFLSSIRFIFVYHRPRLSIVFSTQWNSQIPSHCFTSCQNGTVPINYVLLLAVCSAIVQNIHKYTLYIRSYRLYIVSVIFAQFRTLYLTLLSHRYIYKSSFRISKTFEDMTNLATLSWKRLLMCRPTHFDVIHKVGFKKYT